MPATSLKSNIWKLNAIKAFRWFLLIIPVFIPFLESNGLSLRQAFLLQAAFSIVIVALEIPSGYFADTFGRKNSIIIGSIAGFLGYFIYSLSHSFTGFLFAEIILAIGGSFISGADSALLYDTLSELGEADQFKKYEGQRNFFESSSEGLASILGGFLAAISLRLPLVLQTGVIFLSVPLAFMLLEPKLKHRDKSLWNASGIIHTVKFALHDQAQVKWLTVYSALIGALTLTATWFIQPYFSHVALPLFLFGAVWAFLQFLVAIFSYFAHNIEAALGRKYSLLSLLVLGSLAFVALSTTNSLWGLLILPIFFFVRGINGPVLLDYINRLTPSNIRATVLSVRSLVSRLMFSVLGPIFGWINDLYSLPFALMLTGITFFLLGIIPLLFLYKHKAL